jgi:hypothetical protein
MSINSAQQRFGKHACTEEEVCSMHANRCACSQHDMASHSQPCAAQSAKHSKPQDGTSEVSTPAINLTINNAVIATPTVATGQSTS